MEEKKILKEKSFIEEKTVYISVDGKEFTDMRACYKHERDYYRSIANNTIETTDCDSPNFDGGENYESHNYRWYRPRNKEEILLLINAYGEDTNIGETDIGKWVCIETDCGDDYIWTTTLEDGINYARSILDKLGFDMEIKPKENA